VLGGGERLIADQLAGEEDDAREGRGDRDDPPAPSSRTRPDVLVLHERDAAEEARHDDHR
jgi:hypothetical protein